MAVLPLPDMNNQNLQKNNRQVANWLLAGVVMIIIQVLIGGITRLTESGLSITEWKPITGALPPLDQATWQAEFDKYRMTDQFKYVHQDFRLEDFKFIFFWEWMHRLWARLLGLVFLIGFVYFLIRRKLNRQMIAPMILLFLLGALQGLIGWLMVKSGLVPEKYFVGHVELTTHLLAALVLLAYTLWFALSLMPSMSVKLIDPNLNRILAAIIIVFFCQLAFGGFMAGLKAAQTAPTWPDINGRLLPAGLDELQPWWKNLVNNKIAVQFTHRGLGYILLVLVLSFYWISRRAKGSVMFARLRNMLFILIIYQVGMGIGSLLYATQPAFIWFGVAHQFGAMLLVINLVGLRYLVRPKGSRAMAG